MHWLSGILGVLAVAVLPATAWTQPSTHRLQVSFGYGDAGASHHAVTSPFSTSASVENVVAGFSYAYGVNERVSTTVTLRALVASAETMTQLGRALDHTTVVTSALFGVRFYPSPSLDAALRPYVTAGIGPYLGVETSESVRIGSVETRTTTRGTFGGFFGGGLDIAMGGRLVMGLETGYHVIGDFGEPIGGHRNYSGFEVTAGFGVVIG